MELVLHHLTRQKIDGIRRRPARSYLFFGPSGVGKRQAALWLAKIFNCQTDGNDNCQVCIQIQTGSYPDLLVVESEQKIGIATVQQLQKQLDLASYSGQGRRVVIIDASTGITTEAQNCLLKTLEEPPLGSLVVLIGHNIDQFLPTVLSRLLPIHFPALPDHEVAQALSSKYGPKTANEVAALALGRVGYAVALANDADLRSQQLRHQEIAANLIDQSLFDRLKTVAGGGDSVDWQQVGSYLIGTLGAAARNGKQANLAAIEKFYRHLSSNVNPRAAAEALVLNL